MHLHRRTVIQLVIFSVIALLAMTLMSLVYLKLPAMLFGLGRYTVRVELPEAAGLYPTGNVTFRGTEVGRIASVHLTNTGVEAELTMRDGIDIPSELKANVRSQSAIGEQFVELTPTKVSSRPLRNGDVIPLSAVTVPQDINTVLDTVTTGLRAVPHDNLKTAIDESYTAVGGLGPELRKIIKGGSDLSIDARKNLDPLITLIDQSQPVLNSQTNTSDAIQAWASHLASVTNELQAHDQGVASLIENGGPAAAETRQLVERLQPTLPIILANLTSLGQVALTYQNDVEELLVLLPQMTAAGQAGLMANADTKQDYHGQYLSFHLNLNLPPACTTGFLPAQQLRVPNLEDAPERPAGDLYCRIPQDSPFNVRAARNTPCETRPGKRAPTVKLCESSDEYVPLNEGFNWKGDPNGTVTGQDIPQLPPGSPPQGAPGAPAQAPLAIAAAEYDPATGTYMGPDGHQYTQSDLAQDASPNKTWESMLVPPGS
jgi:phospholipid/cholesterol/gamma-HCH transport system substrate-binding protein